MSEGFKIQQGVEIPVRKSGLAHNCYSELTKALVALKPGDSFFLLGYYHQDVSYYHKRVTKYLGFKFVAKTTHEDGGRGIRIWRIE